MKYVKKKEIKKKNLEYSNNKSVKVIYHLADIHIRLDFRRYNEYTEVFNRLYKKIREEEQEFIVVICGDILHSKNELSPEVVQLTINFFKSLGNITDLFIIMGNHDVNLANKKKLDSLTPLVSEIVCNNNIHYLKSTGIYKYKNITFGVTSILDNILIKANEIKDNNIKIALYHGSVHGAMTDVGYRMNDSEFTIEDFNGYDYVLLGDIHKYQYLDNNKRICYASSLIQQSHGERIDYHGCVRWDLENKKSEFINIKNDYGFITLNINNGKIEDLNNIENMPIKPRIRLLLKNTNKSQYIKICDRLRLKYDVQEITSSFVTNKNNIDLVNETNFNENININENNIKYKNKLIKEYIKRNVDMTKKNIDKILKLNKKLNKEIKCKEINNVYKWKLLKLNFSNMFSYGENNEINFEKLNGIVGIFAPNFYGKSSILDIIQFCLFDRCSRGIRTEILNNKKSEFNCELKLEINGSKYKIIREGKKIKKHAKNIRIDVWFWKVSDDTDNWILLNGKDRHETNKIIASYIGSYEDFIMTSLKLQKDINFVDYPQCKKKDFLIKLLKIDLFDILSRSAKDKLKEIIVLYDDLIYNVKKINLEERKMELKSLKEKKSKVNKEVNEYKKRIKKNHNIINNLSINIKNINIKDIKEKYNTETKRLNELNDNILKLNNDIEYIEKDKKKYKDDNLIIKKNNVYVDEENIIEKNVIFHENKTRQILLIKEKLKEYYLSLKNVDLETINNIDNIKKKKKIIDKKKLKIRDSLNNLNNKLVIIKDKYTEEENEETITINYNNYINKKENLNEYKLILSNNNNSLNKMNEKIKKLSEHKYDPNCEYCINNIFVKDAINTKGNYMNKIIERNDNIIKNNIINRYLYENEGNLQDYYYLEKIRKNNLICISEQNKLLNKKNILEKDQHIAEISSDNIVKEINNYKIYKKNKKINDNIKDKIIDNEHKLKEIKSEENNEYDNYILFKNKKNKNKDKIKNIKLNLMEKKNKLLDYKHNQKLSENLINDMNINKKFILENETNKILIENIKNKINDDELCIKNLDKELHNIHNNIFLIRNDIKSYKEKMFKLKKLEKKRSLILNYIKIVNKDGLPYNLLKNIIPTIVNISNNILLSITNFTISIDMDKNNINIFKNDNSYKNIVSLCSGFEQFMIGLAIRIALTQVNNLSLCSFIAIDEGFSCMDSTNINNLTSLMNYLRDKFDFVLLMSHIQNIKGECDNNLTITRDKGLSNILFK